MPHGIYISAEGCHVQSERLKVVSNNLANVDTTGFKRDVPVFQARFAEAIQRGLNQPGGESLDDLSGGVLLVDAKTDFSPGTLKWTDRPSDLAIESDAFFVIQRGKQNFLTRAGNFSINSTGKLVTQSGDAVLSESGTPVAIDPDLGPWAVSANGTLEQAGDTIPLALARPKHLSDLVKVGDNLFMSLSKPLPVPPEDRRVVSGALEGSGVRPTLEMMELIESSRAFEANTNMIRNQDGMLGTLISRVLKDS